MALFKSASSLVIGTIGYTVLESGNILQFVVSSSPQMLYNSIYCKMLLSEDLVKYKPFNVVYKDLKLFGINEKYINYTLSFDNKIEAHSYKLIMNNHDKNSIEFKKYFELIIINDSKNKSYNSLAVLNGLA